MLQEILDSLTKLPPEEQKKLMLEAAKIQKTYRFIPNPGPQTDAYNSKADILLYGGSAGGGKSQLLLGLGSQCHSRSIIFRRESSQTDGLEADGKKMICDSARYNGVDMEWNWPDGRSLKLAGMKEPDDWMKQAGRERDYMGYDEAGEFLENQVSSMLAWLRGPKDRRCRMVLASNPPRKAEGLWLIKWFAPWLDRNFPNPAQQGELRYAVFTGNGIQWVEGNAPVTIEGKEFMPLSLTFIAASLQDNPFRNTPEYKTKLQSLPEPLRSQLLFGDFSVGMKDADYQVIPTDWIIAAQNRWTERPPQGMAMTAMALDPAGGGRDSAELAYRYGGWYAPIISAQGVETADGSSTAATVLKYRRDNAPVVIDVGGGYGGAVMLRLADNGLECVKFNGANASTAKTKDKQLAFANKRAEAWWKFREELDPDQEGGSAIALPPGSELRADLTAPTWKLTAHGIQIESKVDIKKRIGRSPGKGDAVVMSLSEANKAIMRSSGMRTPANLPRINMGHEHARRRTH